MRDLLLISEHERLPSPGRTPQALTWHRDELWMGSRDLRRVYRMGRRSWKVIEGMEAPGTPWAAVSAGGALWFTLGEGVEDDRYLRRYVVGSGVSDGGPPACPELTGS